MIIYMFLYSKECPIHDRDSVKSFFEQMTQEYFESLVQPGACSQNLMCIGDVLILQEI